MSVLLLCRFDMFSIELHRAKFDADGRSYFLQGLLKDEPEQKKHHPYRYHCRGNWGDQGGQAGAGRGGRHHLKGSLGWTGGRGGGDGIEGVIGVNRGFQALGSGRGTMKLYLLTQPGSR